MSEFNVQLPSSGQRSDNLLQTEMVESSRSETKRTLSIFCKLSVALNVLLLVTISCIQIYINFIRGTFHHGVGENDRQIPGDKYPTGPDVMCIPCNDLGSGLGSNDTLYDNIITTSCGNRLCCIQDKPKEYLIELVMKMVYRRKLDSTNDNSLLWWRKRQNAAHLYLKTPMDQTPVTWTAEDMTGSAFSSLKMTSSNERVIIPQHGLYFVYAVFSFDFSRHLDASGEIPQIYHNITKQHPLLKRTGQRAILMSKYGGMKSDDKTYTSFLCGVFDFQAGFQISTHASNIDVIDTTSKYKSFFGVFQIHS